MTGPTTWTPERVAELKRRAHSGQSSFDIAAAMATSPGSVRYVCGRHDIRLKRKGGAAATQPSQMVGQWSREQLEAMNAAFARRWVAVNGWGVRYG